VFKGVSFTVTDIDLDEVLLSGIPLTDAESPAFDGIRLKINDLEKARLDSDSTGWSAGTATVSVSVLANSVTVEGVRIELLATPVDYRVAMTASVQGNSSALFGFPAKPIRFTVENVQAGEPRQILFTDPDGDGYPSSGEEFFILEPDPAPDGEAELRLAWKVGFFGSPVVDPTSGDILDIITVKPLTEEDVYEFAVSEATTASESGLVPEGFDLKSNYPNPFTHSTTIPYVIGDAAHVSLTIHDILGRRVAELTPGRMTGGDHLIVWDGLSSAGALVPSGVYFYTLSATADDGTALRQETRPMSVVR